MGTKFTDIYCQNQLIKNDERLSRMTDYLYYSICWKYLKSGIGYVTALVNHRYNNYINKFINYTAYQEIDYNFVSDGEETDFILSPAPLVGGILYVAIREKGFDVYVENENYTFDTITNTITFNTPPTTDSDILVVSYIIGEFTNELNNAEINILSESMNIAYLEEQQNKTKLLNQMVYIGDFKIYSQANHLGAVSQIVQNQRKYVESLAVAYSYTSNAENYTGLTGFREV